MKRIPLAFLEQVHGLEVNFPDGLPEHGRRLMAAFGVTVTEDPFATSTAGCA